MAEATSLETSVQYIALGVYLLVSIFAARMAWLGRDQFQSLNKEKGAGVEEVVAAGLSPGDLPASFSRTVGLVGAISLAGFMWCIGLLILAGHPLLDSQGFNQTLRDFILASSALFAPYAFNQLSKIFPVTSSAAIGAAAATVTARADLKTPIPPPPVPVASRQEILEA